MSQQELDAVLAFIAESGDLSSGTLEEQRAQFNANGEMIPVPDDVTIEEVDAGGRPAFWITGPKSRPDHVILYLHGGGYVLGSPLSHRALTIALAEAAEATVVSLDYRLAPENIYPAAVEDAVNAYQWLVKDKGIAPGKIAVSGDSAGGGLSAATLMLLRDRELGEPAAGMLISPWADLTCEAKSMTSRAEIDPWLEQATLKEMAATYLGGKDAESHLASPVFGRLEGLPPLLIQVGSREILHDDAIRLAGQAAEAHIDVTLEVWEGMIHVWHYFAPMLEEGRQAIAKMGAFYKAKTAA